MKILYHHRIKSKDGQFVHIEELVRQLESLGHDIRFVGPTSEHSKDFGSDSSTLNLVRKVLPQFLYEAIEFAYCLLDFAKLVIAIRRFRPDAIYERYNLFLPSGIWAKRLFGLRLVLEVNAPLVEERDAFGGLSLKKLARWSQKYAWTGADHVITVTEVLKDIIVDYGVAAEKVTVMPNGVNRADFEFTDSERSATRNELGVGENFVIGFTGFAREWHRLEHILQLMTRPPFESAVFLVVGDGPAIESLKQVAAKLGVGSRFIVTGVVARDKVANYVAAFDVAIQAHVVEYASPLKVLEYLSMGRAIVAPESRNIRELLTDGHNALLFDSGDRDSLGGALTRLMTDGNLRASLEDTARRTIEERGLTWRANAERTTDLLEDPGAV